MLTIIAHAGHSHGTETGSGIDHCGPVIIGAGITVALLLVVIIYLLVQWQPKKQSGIKKDKRSEEKVKKQNRK